MSASAAAQPGVAGGGCRIAGGEQHVGMGTMAVHPREGPVECRDGGVDGLEQPPHVVAVAERQLGADERFPEDAAHGRLVLPDVAGAAAVEQGEGTFGVAELEGGGGEERVRLGGDAARRELVGQPVRVARERVGRVQVAGVQLDLGGVDERPQPQRRRAREARGVERVLARPPRHRELPQRGLRGAEVRERMRATSRPTPPGDYYHTFLLTLYALLRTPLLADPELTAARLDDDCAALREHLAGAHTVTCMPLLWQAWGSAP